MKSRRKPPVVCCTDFSKNAVKAADAAAAIASCAKRRLVLLHVADEFQVYAENEDELERFRERVGEKLTLEADRLRAAGVAVDAEMLQGTKIEKTILEWIAEHETMLLVVAAGRQRRWVLGGTSERLAESASFPTLVVRNAAPFRRWAKGDHTLKVFVGTDFSVSSAKAIEWVATLRKLGPCEIMAAYVSWPPEEAMRLGVQGQVPLVEQEPEMVDVLKRDLREKVGALLGKENLRVLVQGGWGTVDGHLVSMAAEEKADLAVVGAHQRRGLDALRHRSVSRGVLRHAPMNVACVPASVVEPLAVRRIHPCPRVLVAVDLGSAHGFVASYAYGIVSRGGRVRLAHVIDPYIAPSPYLGGSLKTYRSRKARLSHITQCRARLHALAPAEIEARETKTEVDVLEDLNVAKAICHAAERFNADVVCIGSHTRPGLMAKALGSVALDVLRRCRRPVLVVWPPKD